MTDDSGTWSFEYNADGLRVYRSNGTDTYKYYYNGDKLSRMVVNGQKITFGYDANGTPQYVLYDGNRYFYLTNLQGDVTAIVSVNGNIVVEYTYDAWGNILSIDGVRKDNLGKLNPLRYRGYVYDEETELYYLQSRYYDPAIGRFINADVYASTGQGLLGNNMFAYCNNNPIVRKDTAGTAVETAWDIASFGLSIGELIADPYNVWSWLGVAGDFADIVIPCVGGIGEATRAVKAATQAGELIDTASDVKKGWKLGDDITSLTKAGNRPSWSTVRQRYWKNEAYYHPDLYPDDLDRLKQGRAPIGEDGFSMELHHPHGRDGENFFIFEPMTQTQHRWIHYGG